MKRIQTVFLALALLCAPLSFASTVSFTLVSGTVVDPNGLAYANGTITATLVISGSPVFGGAGLGVPTPPANTPYTPPTQPVGLDKNGSFSMQLADNNALLPGGSQWNFQVCSAVGTIQPAGGKGPICFTLAAPITITGATQSISTNLNAVAPALSNISGGGATPFSSITSGTNTGAAMVVGSGASLTTSGTGLNTATNIVYGPVFTPEQFGAVKNGSTDDSGAIQSAINAAGASGGTVSFCTTGEGIYAAASTLAVTTSLTNLIGPNTRGCFIKFTGATTADILTYTGTAPTPLIFNRMEYLTLFRSAAATGSSAAGIRYTFVNTMDVTRVESFDSIFDFFATSSSNIVWNKCQAVANIISSATTNTGWQLSGNQTSSRMIDSNSVGITNNMTFGITMTGGADIWIVRHGFTGMTFSGTEFNVTGPIENVHLIDPALEGGGTSGNLIVVSGSNGTVNNGGATLPVSLEIDDPYLAYATSRTGLIAVTINNSENVKINGGVCQLPGASNCVIIEGASSVRNTVQGMTINSTGGTNTNVPIVVETSASNNIITNNTCKGPSGTPFLICFDFLSSSKNVVANNSCGGFGTTCINFDASSNSNQVGNNSVDLTNITNGVLDAGSGNTKNWTDQGQCTMAAGVCTAQTLGSHTYGAAPQCTGSWNGTGTLTGLLKFPSTTTTVTPTSTVNTDTAVVSWVCRGN